MKETDARLMGEMGSMSAEVEGFMVGQNELKEQIKENTDTMK